MEGRAGGLSPAMCCFPWHGEGQLWGLTTVGGPLMASRDFFPPAAAAAAMSAENAETAEDGQEMKVRGCKRVGWGAAHVAGDPSVTISPPCRAW